MELHPLVSIIINNYNYDRFLAEAIDSALNQTYPHVEVIVVDDGSTDGSRDIIAGYGERIIPVLQENGKQGAAFNNGFAHSQGDIIIFLDSDDYLFPQAIDRIVAVWQPDVSKVHYRLNVIDEEGKDRGFSYPQGSAPLSTGEVWRSVIQVGTYCGTPTSGNALSRKALSQVMPIPFEYRSTSDDYLSVLIPLYGTVLAIDEPLGAYRIHTNNQWAIATLSSDRYRRFVNHDLQRCDLIMQRATALGYEVPDDLNLRFFGRAWSRLASLRLDPQNHPVKTDRALFLSYSGILALWRFSAYNTQKRLIYSLWFIWVGVMPLPLAEPAITWLFAPQFRPKPIHWTLTKLRSLMN